MLGKQIFSALDLTSRKILYKLLIVSISLVIMYLITSTLYKLGYVGEYLNSLFHLDMEVNVPTWYSTVQLAFTSMLCFMIANNDRALLRPRRNIIYFNFIGMCYLLLSLDELLQFHELFDKRNSFGIEFNEIWVIYFFPFVALFGIFLIYIGNDIFKNEKNLFKVFVTGMIVFFTGALIVEISKQLIFLSETLFNFPGIFSLQLICEEFMEMIGISISLCSLLTYKFSQNELLYKDNINI